MRLFVRQIFTEGDSDNVLRVAALYEVIRSLYLAVYAVVAKLSCDKTYLLCALAVPCDKVFAVKGGGEGFSVVGVHTACTVNYQLIENAC